MLVYGPVRSGRSRIAQPAGTERDDTEESEEGEDLEDRIAEVMKKRGRLRNVASWGRGF